MNLIEQYLIQLNENVPGDHLEELHMIAQKHGSKDRGPSNLQQAGSREKTPNRAHETYIHKDKLKHFHADLEKAGFKGHKDEYGNHTHTKGNTTVETSHHEEENNDGEEGHHEVVGYAKNSGHSNLH